jgi:uncharacterized protein YcbK (DUF882 family)
VTVNFAHSVAVPRIPVRTGLRCGLAALLVLFGCESLQNATAEGDTRTLSFHHIHTNEDLTITYKVNGRYDEEALKKINWVLRDWRKEESIKMDPHAIDVLWEVHRSVGANEPIWVICGYRSPTTNSMLRRRSSGVAKFSQHMLGKAIDFYIPGVPLSELREMGLRLERGGVGFYPESNFVHLDTGSVRHWPRMPEAQLARVMAKGSPTMMAAKDRPVRTASTSSSTLAALTRLVGGGKDEEDDAETASTTPQTPVQAPARAARVPAPTPRPSFLAALEPKAEKADKPMITAAVPMPPAKPAGKPAARPAGFEVAAAASRPVELPSSRLMQTASLDVRAGAAPSDVINERGFWRGMAEPLDTSSTRSITPSRKTAAADPVATGSLAPWPLPDRLIGDSTLAYAPANAPTAPVRTASLGSTNVRMTPTAPKAVVVPPDTTIAVKRVGNQPSIVAQAAAPGTSQGRPGESLNDPWLRAMIVSPSAQGFMNTSLFGAADFRNLGAYLQKPTAAVMMTFSDDPHLGMIPERFNGHAVVFVSTVTFYQRTAMLQ